MSNAKIISLVAEEYRKATAEAEHGDVIAITVVEDELLELRENITQLQQRIADFEDALRRLGDEIYSIRKEGRG